MEQEQLLVPSNLIELEHQGNEEPTTWLLDQGNLRIQLIATTFVSTCR
jgi:hypothetical protein